MARIAVDATAVTIRPTGAGRVVRSLLAALPSVDPEHEYVGLVTAEGAAAFAGLGDAVRLRIVSPGRSVTWELSGAARAAAAAGADLVFTVRELVGRASPPTVLHVFEPPSWRLQARSGPPRHAAKDAVLAALLGRSLRRSAAVTAGSATTAAWLREHHGVDATVVLPGLDDRFFEDGGPPAPVDAPYLLHLSSGDARDFGGLLLEALALLGADAPRLVVAGPGAAAFSGRAEVLGWVSDEELRSLYRGALAYVHLSRYESYGGLAALEAMAVGTPVVAFEAPGVTEALAGAALLVEERDARAVAAALRELAVDPGLCAGLAAAGRERVEPLRWERSATGLAAVFARVLS